MNEKRRENTTIDPRKGKANPFERTKTFDTWKFLGQIYSAGNVGSQLSELCAYVRFEILSRLGGTMMRGHVSGSQVR